MKKPTIFSTEIPNASYKKRNGITSIIVCVIPVLSSIYLEIEQAPTISNANLTGLVIFLIWLGSELAIIKYLLASKTIPKYIFESFQLNLLFANMWFLWALLAHFSN